MTLPNSYPGPSQEPVPATTESTVVTSLTEAQRRLPVAEQRRIAEALVGPALDDAYTRHADYVVDHEDEAGRTERLTLYLPATDTEHASTLRLSRTVNQDGTTKNALLHKAMDNPPKFETGQSGYAWRGGERPKLYNAQIGKETGNLIADPTEIYRDSWVVGRCEMWAGNLRDGVPEKPEVVPEAAVAGRGLRRLFRR